MERPVTRRARQSASIPIIDAANHHHMTFTSSPHELHFAGRPMCTYVPCDQLLLGCIVGLSSRRLFTHSYGSRNLCVGFSLVHDALSDPRIRYLREWQTYQQESPALVAACPSCSDLSLVAGIDGPRPTD